MDPAASGEDDEAILDLYLDARIRGDAVDAAAFCAKHESVSPEMRARLEAIDAAAAPRPAPGLNGSAPADAAALERLGEFRIVRRLDQGGMGSVFLAVQESLRREVALKVMRPELRDSADATERFRREALAVARLRHPNIVGVIAVGEERGVRYLAMDLVPGRTLDDVLAETAARGGTIEPERALRWARDLARALHCAHEEGVIHRDVKPGNVRITPDDRPMLLDFGIARDTQSGGPTLTQTFAGSPLYAAPEQLSGAPLDARADVYALGVTLYQCLTGRVPFAGGTMEEVLRRVLVEEPLAPRRLHPAIPRDAETVVLAALAKEPDRRYATAAAFADDLDAVLTARPIRARPPGPISRLAKWARRRPAIASVLATSVLVALGVAVVAAANERAAADERRRKVGGALTEARARLDVYRTRRSAMETAQRDATLLRDADKFRSLTRDEDRSLTSKEAAVDSFLREREVTFQETLELLRFAERLDADATAAADDVRAELYRERWFEARAARDVVAANFFKGRVAAFDHAGRFAAELRCTRRLYVTTDPPGASVHLFRCREVAELEPDGERRLVPVPPAGVTWPVPPGTWALRVVSATGDLAPGDVVVSLAGRPIRDTVLVTRGAGDVHRLDRLVSIDGVPVTATGDLLASRAAESATARTFKFERDGAEFDVRGPSLAALGVDVDDPARCAMTGDVPADVWSRGEVRHTVLPRGIEVRATAAPVFVSARTVAGAAPLSGFEIEEGAWIAVLEAPGRERVVAPIAITDDPSSPSLSARLPVLGETPRGFVPIAPALPRVAAFAIMEREVTAAEYLEFLNDPATLARIDASPEPILFPRSPDTRLDGGYWQRGADGRYEIPPSMSPEWPALGVSWHDAREYAAWRTARSAAAGRPHESFALPTRDEWVAAGGVHQARVYVFGSRFSTKWVKCCFARSLASPEPVLSYPVDESPAGAFDMSGSAYEWVDWWFDESRALRLMAGGSWGQTDGRLFQIFGGTGGRETHSGGETGFRLVAHREEPK